MIFDLKNEKNVENAISMLQRATLGYVPGEMTHTDAAKFFYDVMAGPAEYDTFIRMLSKAIRMGLCVEVSESNISCNGIGRIVGASLTIDDNNEQACELIVEILLVPYGIAGHKKIRYAFNPFLTDCCFEDSRTKKYHLYAHKGEGAVSMIFHIA